MSNDNGSWFAGDGIFAIIIFFIVAGIIGNGFGGWGNNSNANQITNDFLYTNLANQVRDNATAIAATDRDVLQSRFDTQLGLQNLQAMQSSCCCELKTAIHSEGEATRALITQNRISDLEKDLVNANTIISNATQTQNILNQLGNYYPKSGVNPYYVYGYNGTTII